MRHTARGRWIKELGDRLGAVVLLVLLSPVILLTALAIFVSMGRPVVFRQRRPGLGGRCLTVYKFRTMTEATRDDGRPHDDAARLTALGRFLRRSSLDELPQLVNVIKGEMSFVGPRPLLEHYLPLYSEEQARRHLVKPGITGWAQVNGRNTIGWEERLALDVWYVDNWSLALDLRILAMTVQKVLARSGTSAEGHATMPEFTGSPPRGGGS
ncbi:MAG: sugar transferase [Fimbriimonadaceae bacterium]|nr:sugar transferase [Fimbriimonadaceae bacterium]QYK59268.1 MAG: sugar transferase [Fimbriimonadaceae bacterium]